MASKSTEGYACHCLKESKMGKSPNQTFRKTAFYGNAYVPTYSPITLMTHADREHTNAIGEVESNDLMLIGAEGGRQSPGAQHDSSFGINDEKRYK